MFKKKKKIGKIKINWKNKKKRQNNADKK